tara:strand:+ start:26389 stop:27369 length:981 start_codon:yes stop_codon:yes gene_type:complete
MKNILAENMLRFNVKNLTELNIKRLSEQDTNEPLQPGQEANPLPDQPKSPEKIVNISTPDKIKQMLQGTHKNTILSIPGWDKFLKVFVNKSNQQPYIAIDFGSFSNAYATYLGATNGRLTTIDSIIGKQIFRFIPGVFDNYSKGDAFSDENRNADLIHSLNGNNIDSIIKYAYVPVAAVKSFYKGEHVFLSTSKKGFTTDYSGNPQNPVSTESAPNGDGSVPGGTSKTYDSYYGDTAEKRAEAAFVNLQVPMEGPRGNTSNRELLTIPKNPEFKLIKRGRGIRMRIYMSQQDGWGSNWQFLVNDLNSWDTMAGGKITNVYNGQSLG